jgi:phosphohistidine phosphatase
MFQEVSKLKLYLVQHGEAKPKDEDPERSLTDRGISDIRAVLDTISMYGGVKIRRILHSGKKRARQTAEIIGEWLAPSDGIQRVDSLEPLADPLIWAEQLKMIEEDILLVGHLPHMSKLASYLLTGDAEKEVIKFAMGGIVCLEMKETGDWKLVWMLIPQLVNTGVT